MSEPATKRRWFRFSLATLFVWLTGAGIVGGYWVACEMKFRRERSAYQEALALYEAEVTTTADVCNASRKLFDTEISVPFADGRAAAAAHVERVRRIRLRDHLIAVEGYWPTNSWPERQRMIDEADRHYAEAQRLASQYP